MSVFDYDGSSIEAIKVAADTSGLLQQRPLLYVTSDYREGGPFHGTSQAVDFGSDVGDAGSPQMDRFAGWVAERYGPVSLELIHVNQDGSSVEWKFGERKPHGWYGADTLAGHRNHVHWAITNSGLAAVPIEEFTMDQAATAAIADLKKTVQDNSQQLVTVVEGVPAGHPNPYGLVGLRDIAARLDKIEAALTRLAAGK